MTRCVGKHVALKIGLKGNTEKPKVFLLKGSPLRLKRADEECLIAIIFSTCAKFSEKLPFLTP